jgi:drug/metabolite transporter (DMT)-like permease
VIKSKDITPRRAALELTGAGALWGFGFIATVWSLGALEPIWSVVLRYILVALIGIPLLFHPAYRGMRGWDQAKITFWAGNFMSLTMILQTWGLKYTTATKSSFITVTYVLMVPVIERLIFKRKVRPSLFFFALLGLFGTALICEFNPLDPAVNRWNWGDLMTLGCALAGAGQIIALGIVSQKIQSSFVVNIYQCLWGFVLPAVLAPFIGGPLTFDGFTVKAAVGLVYVVVGSTLVAFMLQVRAQRVLNPSLASLLFLLESPFAALFAAVFLSEHLNSLQWLGAFVILLSSFGAIRSSRV